MLFLTVFIFTKLHPVFIKVTQTDGQRNGQVPGYRRNLADLPKKTGHGDQVKLVIPDCYAFRICCHSSINDLKWDHSCQIQDNMWDQLTFGKPRSVTYISSVYTFITRLSSLASNKVFIQKKNGLLS